MDSPQACSRTVDTVGILTLIPAQLSFQKISYPTDARFTQLLGIDANGLVVGLAATPSMNRVDRGGDWLSQSLKRVSPRRASSPGTSVRSLTSAP